MVLSILLLGYSLGAVILALMGRLRHLMIALSAWAVLTGPDLVERAGMWMNNVDFRYVLSAGRVDVVNRGPIAFTKDHRHNPYGGRRYSITTTVMGRDGPQQIGFNISSVSMPGAGYDFASCPTAPAKFGLREITGDTPGKFCPYDPHRNNIYYVSLPQDGPVVWVQSFRAGDGIFHSMTVRHNGMNIRVFMWKTPLADWKAVRDDVIAILDQSFTPIPEK